MTRRLVAIMLVVGGCLVVEATAHAMSCQALEDHFVVRCQASRCEPLFRAVQKDAPGICGRALEIVPFPDWARDFVLETVHKLRGERPGVVSVDLSHRYGNVARNVEALRDSFLYWDAHVTEHPEGESALRSRFEHQASDDGVAARWEYAKRAFGLIGVIVALAGSSLWLLVALRTRERDLHPALLGRVLGIKGLLFLVGMFSIVAFAWTGFALALLVPGAVAFALLDLAIYFLARLGRTF